jgi:hypothetical protein
MIPHHHHEQEWNKISNNHSHLDKTSHDDPHHHHGTDSHEHDNSKKSDTKHNHSFPFHHHFNSTDDLVWLRLKLNTRSLTEVKAQSAFYVFIQAKQGIEPPETDFQRFTDPPFLIISAFESGANGLRAPPSVA